MRPNALGLLAALLLSVLVFYLRCGWGILDYSYTGWMLYGGDQAPDMLAWEHYRISPWHWNNWGYIEGYAYPQHPPMVLTCGLPLFGVFFKLFDAWLPAVFQYFGYWYLMCYVLQAWFAWKLLHLVYDWKSEQHLALLALCFLLTAAPFLDRVPHVTLCGHWLILGQLYFYLLGERLSRRRRFWGHLSFLLMGTLVHPYFVVFNGALLAADYAQAYLKLSYSWKRALGELSLIGLFFLTHSYLWGFFSWSGDSSSSAGYGHYSANLLCFVNPEGLPAFERDNRTGGLLPLLPTGEGQYEGGAYLGLGILLALPYALWLRYRQGVRAWQGAYVKPLIWAAVLLFLFAISHHIRLFRMSVHLPLPEQIVLFLGKFRASGRFVWLAYYLIVFWTLLTIGRASHLKSLAKTAVFLLFFGLQMWDMSYLFSKPNFFPQAADYQMPFDTARLAPLLRRADLLVAYPPYTRHTNAHEDYVHLVHLGYLYGKPVTTGNLARENRTVREAFEQELNEWLQKADWKHSPFKNSLFITSEDYLSDFEPLLEQDALRVYADANKLFLAPSDWVPVDLQPYDLKQNAAWLLMEQTLRTELPRRMGSGKNLWHYLPHDHSQGQKAWVVEWRQDGRDLVLDIQQNPSRRSYDLVLFERGTGATDYLSKIIDNQTYTLQDSKFVVQSLPIDSLQPEAVLERIEYWLKAVERAE